MVLRELYHPESGRMRVAGFMSGGGSNLIKIIDHSRRIAKEQGRSPYEVVVIFSDNPKSKAEVIGKDYQIPVVVRDLAAFYAARGKPKRDLEVRAEFDRGTVESLKPFRVDVVAYAGYMSIATKPLIDAFLGVNVHPADLTIKVGKTRKYTGDHVVEDAIFAGERMLRATTHIVEKEVDNGRILMVSRGLSVTLPEGFDKYNGAQLKEVAKDHQDKLKVVGDWEIFPKTLEYISDGRFSRDEDGNLYFDNNPIPNGLRAELL